MKMIHITVIVVASILIAGAAFAGPMDNAQQFQKKTVESSLKKEYVGSKTRGMTKVPADKVKTVDLSEYVNTGANNQSAVSEDAKIEKDGSIIIK